MQEASNQTEHSEDKELELTDVSERTLRTKKIAMAAIFASLSIAITPIASFIPRMPWGLALFDPSSIFWLIAFMLGGPLVGMISMVSGAVVLNFFDPFAPIGPILKFLATFPLIFIPWLAVKSGVASKLAGKESEEEDSRGGGLLANPKVYLLLMLVAYCVRLAVMVPFNLAIAPIAFPFLTVEEIFTITLIINTIQTIFDAAIPYIVIHPTKVFNQFRLW